MFKHAAVVEEIRPEAGAPSFQVVDLANPMGLIQPDATKEGWVDACDWGTSCGGCSQTGTCTGGPSCVGCSNSFNNPHRGSDKDTITEGELLKAIMG